MTIIEQGQFSFTVSPDGVAEIRGVGHIDLLRQFVVERYKEYVMGTFKGQTVELVPPEAPTCDT